MVRGAALAAVGAVVALAVAVALRWTDVHDAGPGPTSVVWEYRARGLPGTGWVAVDTRPDGACQLRLVRDRTALVDMVVDTDDVLWLTYTQPVYDPCSEQQSVEPAATAVMPTGATVGARCDAAWAEAVRQLQVAPPRRPCVPRRLWASCCGTAWSGRNSTAMHPVDAFPVAVLQTAVQDGGRRLGLLWDPAAVRTRCAGRHDGQSGAWVGLWPDAREAWVHDTLPPYGAVDHAAAVPVAVGMCDGTIDADAGPSTGAQGSHSAAAADGGPSPRERWTPATVRVEVGPFDVDVVADAPYRASVHWYAAEALGLWRSVVADDDVDQMDPVVAMVVDRVSWWRRDAGGAQWVPQTATVTTSALVEIVGSTTRWRYAALVQVDDSHVQRPVARVRKHARWPLSSAPPTPSAAIERGVPLALASAGAACPGAHGPGPLLTTATTVAECLATTTSPVAIIAVVGGTTDPTVVRLEDVERFVDPGRLAYIPLLLLRTPQAGCRVPLDDCVDACCADEPVWDYAHMPALVAAPADLIGALGPDSPAERLLDLAGVATALRDRGVMVLRVPLPGEAAPSEEALPARPPPVMVTGAGPPAEATSMDGPSADVTSTLPAYGPAYPLHHGTGGLSLYIGAHANLSGLPVGECGRRAAAADQDDRTFFLAARLPVVNDTLTVTWPVPLWLDALEVFTGSWRYPMHWSVAPGSSECRDPDTSRRLRQGTVEVRSTAASSWEPLVVLSVFHNGVYRGRFLPPRQVYAIQLRVLEAQADPLVVEDVYVTVAASE